MCFYGPLKTFFERALATFQKAHAGRIINEYDVSGPFGEALVKAASTQNAISGFETCVIWPPNQFFSMSQISCQFQLRIAMKLSLAPILQLKLKTKAGHALSQNQILINTESQPQIQNTSSDLVTSQGQIVIITDLPIGTQNKNSGGNSFHEQVLVIADQSTESQQV